MTVNQSKIDFPLLPAGKKDYKACYEFNFTYIFLTAFGQY